MESRFTLKLSDPEVAKTFAIKRSRDINILSTAVLLMRMVLVTFGIISTYTAGQEYTTRNTIMTCLLLGPELILLLLTFKWPLIFARFQAVYAMLSIFFIIANIEDNDLAVIVFAYFFVLAVLFFFVMSALVLSYNWMVTSSCIVVSVVGTVLIFTEKYNIVEL